MNSSIVQDFAVRPHPDWMSETIFAINASRSLVELARVVKARFEMLTGGTIQIQTQVCLDEHHKSSANSGNDDAKLREKDSSLIGSVLKNYPQLQGLRGSDPPWELIKPSSLSREFQSHDDCECISGKTDQVYRIEFKINISKRSSILIHATRERFEFDAHEIAAIEALLPLIRSTCMNVSLLERLQQAVMSLEAGIDDLEESTWFCLDEEGSLLAYSSKAPELFAQSSKNNSYFALPKVLASRIRSTITNWNTRNERKENRDRRFNFKYADRLYLCHIKANDEQGYLVLIVDDSLAKLGSGWEKIDQLSRNSLTPRQREVAYWKACGKRHEEIARLLGISSRTVEKHAALAMEKIGLENRNQLMREFKME